jgi:hypothetical protein
MCDEMGRVCRTMHLGYQLEKQNKRDHWEDQNIDWRIISRWNLEKLDGVVWAKLIWLRIWTSGRLFLTL